MRIIVAGVLSALALGMTARAQTPAVPTTEPGFSNRLAAIARASSPAAGHADALAITHSPQFAAFSTVQKERVWMAAAQSAYQMRNADLALEDLEHVVSPEASFDVWRLRLAIAGAARKSDIARESLLTIVERHPDALARLPDRDIGTAVIAAPTDAAGALRQARLAELLLERWRPTDPFVSLDAVRMVAVRGRLAAGRLAEARALAEQITARDAVLALRMERRYDGLNDGDGWRLPTPRAATEVELARVRALRAASPRRLGGVLRGPTSSSPCARPRRPWPSSSRP